MDEASGISNCDLYLLEEVERQEPHHGAQAEAEAGVGRGDHPEVLQAVAGRAVVDSAGAQPPLRVSRLQGLAPVSGHHQGDQLPAEETLSQVEGELWTDGPEVLMIFKTFSV